MSMRYNSKPDGTIAPWQQVARADGGNENDADDSPSLTPQEADANRNPRDNMATEIATQVDVVNPKGHGVQINSLGE